LSARDDDRGIALVLVITLMTSMIVGCLVAVTYVTGYQPLAKVDQERQAALAAAEAGVDDYLNRLNQDPNYWDDGDAATNPAMHTAPAGCAAPSSTCTWGWVTVAPDSPGSYHYSVDTSDMTSYTETDLAAQSWGTIWVTSTGEVGNVTRTVQVGLRQNNFLNNMYVSQYNLVDPTLYASQTGENAAQEASTVTDCVHTAWQTWPLTYTPTVPVPPPTPPPVTVTETGPLLNAPGNAPASTETCGGLINYWIDGQTINGPMMSYDDYYFYSDPKFLDSVSTSDPFPARAPYYTDPTAGPPDPDLVQGPIVGSAQWTPFPPSIFSYVGNDVAVPQSNNPALGCEYYGPTWIDFVGAPTPNQMYVYSPDTPNTVAHPDTGCLAAPGASPYTTELNLPTNGVIYVANLPATNNPYTGVPNPCTVADPAFAVASFASAGCDGNAFVEGTVDGQITLAADQNVYLEAPPGTNSATIGAYNTSGGDVMGIAAGDYILINHDTSGPATDTFGGVQFEAAIPNLTIDAALFTINGSLALANYWSDATCATAPIVEPCNLIINGAIVSEFMDVEGTFGGNPPQTGYNETYNWDARLAHLTPPYFIPPGDSDWAETSFAELASIGSVGG
jgi:Tfp pilus assembly protein PilX